MILYQKFSPAESDVDVVVQDGLKATVGKVGAHALQAAGIADLELLVACTELAQEKLCTQVKQAHHEIKNGFSECSEAAKTRKKKIYVTF